MLVGIPKEIMSNENRVAATQATVMSLVAAGHKVLVEAGAGEGSGISDAEYQEAGASLAKVDEVWSASELILKVKEPLESEYKHLRSGLIVFTYLHLAADENLTRTMLESGVTGIAYETVQVPGVGLPLLIPMSEVAGRMAPQLGSNFLTKHAGGSGILLAGVPGVPRGHVVIIGGGVAGTNAAKIAAGMGARVTIIDNTPERLRYLHDLFGDDIQTLASNVHNIATSVADADLLIGTALIPGARAPKLVSEDMIKTMRRGSVVIDIAIDQGGCIATSDRMTTHDNPIYVKHGVIHYAVPNMPGAVPRTSTFALTNATLPYITMLADKGWKQACSENAALAKGVNIAEKCCTHQGVASAFSLTYTPIEELLA